jgi:type II secretory pathway pseudopilin PulG
MRNNETGRSMVEMLGVLAIIGVLSAGGLAGYSKAMFKHKLNSTMEQITMFVTNIRTSYGTQRNYANLSMANAYSLGIVPAAISTNGTTFTNPFKGAVDIAPVAVKSAEGSAATAGFTLKYTKLPKEACIALATADFGSGAGSGFVGVDVYASTDKSTPSTVFVGSGSTDTTRKEGAAYTMANAINACSEQATIIWKFY